MQHYHARKLRRHWHLITFIIFMLLLLLLIPFFPRQSTITLQGAESRYELNKTFVITTKSTTEAHYALLDLDIQGDGRLFSYSNNTPLLIYNGAWNNYLEATTIDDTRILVKQGTRYKNISANSTKDWLAKNLPNATVSDARKERPQAPKMQRLVYNFRGEHTVVVVPVDGKIDVTIAKHDLNWYPGNDTLQVTLSEMQGMPIDIHALTDDGIVTSSAVHIDQGAHYVFSKLRDRPYRLTFKSTTNVSDFTYDISILTTYYAVEKKLYAVSPNNITIKGPASLRLATSHKQALQIIKIDNQSMNISKVDTTYTYNVTKGNHKITIPKGDVFISGFSYATFDDYFEPPQYRAQDKTTVILAPVPKIIVNNSAYPDYTIRFVTEGDRLTLGAAEITFIS